MDTRRTGRLASHVLTGSEGGLGVVTELLVSIHPLPQTRWLRGFAFPTVEAAWDAMQDIMQANLWPSVLRLYDPVDTKMTVGRPRPPTPRRAAECSAGSSLWPAQTLRSSAT